MRPYYTRQPPVERAILDQISQGMGIGQVTSLHDLADQRAVDGPVWLDRSLLRDWREELADARNYGIWLAQTMPTDDEARHYRLAALGHTMAAWHFLTL